MKKYFLMAFLCLSLKTILVAQKNNTGNSILWEVTGNGLQKPSYLFGTYHFLSNAFIDTLPAVTNAYKSADAIAGELIMDSSLQAPMMAASVLKGTTLQKVLPDILYAKASAWFKQEADLDMANFERLNPITLMTLAMALTQQKYFPNKPGEVQLDTYFQEEAKKDGKKIIGLEKIEVQIDAMFNLFAIQRQADLLNEMFKDKNGLKDKIGEINKAYVSENMAEMQRLMYGSNYKPEELKVLLDDRNDNWMLQLPAFMQQHSLFVAVGALHLAGKKGLVNLLREQGYKVTPVNLKAK